MSTLESAVDAYDSEKSASRRKARDIIENYVQLVKSHNDIRPPESSASLYNTAVGMFNEGGYNSAFRFAAEAADIFEKHLRIFGKESEKYLTTPKEVKKFDIVVTFYHTDQIFCDELSIPYRKNSLRPASAAGSAISLIRKGSKPITKNQWERIEELYKQFRKTKKNPVKKEA